MVQKATADPVPLLTPALTEALEAFREKLAADANLYRDCELALRRLQRHNVGVLTDVLRAFVWPCLHAE